MMVTSPCCDHTLQHEISRRLPHGLYWVQIAFQTSRCHAHEHGMTTGDEQARYYFSELWQFIIVYATPSCSRRVDVSNSKGLPKSLDLV